MFTPLIIIGPSAKRVTQKRVKQYNLTDEQLNSEIEDSDTPELALCFDNVEMYSIVMGLTPAEQAGVRRLYRSEGTQAAMMKCLQVWKQHNPSQATYRALLDIVGKRDTAHKIHQQLTQRKYMYTCYYMSGDNPPPPKPSTYLNYDIIIITILRLYHPAMLVHLPPRQHC